VGRGAKEQNLLVVWDGEGADLMAFPWEHKAPPAL
jgi:hypothetical protein